MISLKIDQSLTYPPGGFGFSPAESYPEYQMGTIAMQPNPIYKAVRDCFVQAELDAEHLGTPQWNPLGKWITPGERVFVLCNFANERRPDEAWKDYRSRCTHGSVIRAVIDYILIALNGTGSVAFGNAPTQFCHWQQVLKDNQADEVVEFYHQKGIPVQVKDLRLYVTDATKLGAIRSVERRDETMGIHVDLGHESLLAELEQVSPQRYRVMNYDPCRTTQFHSAGKHEYVINRQILESDVIFSIPKFKTHEKVGISCALKGFVGTVGHKDSLPHHRYGSPKMAGDEYPDSSRGVVKFSTAYHERIQQTVPDSAGGSMLRASFRILKRVIRPLAPIIEGAWWGNDTAWRMVLDLVRIANYCSAEGKMQSIPVRKQLALIDGIFGGEGEGPAYPSAVQCGVLLFGDNLPVVDVLNTLLMGFDPDRIPLIRRSLLLDPYPLLVRPLEKESIVFNGKAVTLDEFRKESVFHFLPSEGWKEKLASE